MTQRRAYADLWSHGGEFDSQPVSIGIRSVEADRARRALKVAQSVADMFGDGYRVVFSKHQTATDLDGKEILIATDAIYDDTLTAEERATITTEYAVHEIGHVRDTLPMLNAVRKAYHSGHSIAERQAALTLSNVLEDIRTERKTAEILPGLGPDVSINARRYLSRRGAPVSDIDIAIAALRYPWAIEPNDAVAFWQRWGANPSSDPAEHIRQVAEGIQYLKVQEAERQDAKNQNPESNGSGDGNDGESSEDDSNTGDAPGDADSQNPGGSDPNNGEDDSPSGEDASDPATGTDGDNSESSGGKSTAIAREAPIDYSQAIPSQAFQMDDRTLGDSNLQEGIDTGYEDGMLVNRVGSGPGANVPPSAALNGHIRNAILKARTDKTVRTSGHRSGRLDHRRLHTVPLAADPRPFIRVASPGAPSLLVWLLVDTSGSMRYAMPDCEKMTGALAHALHATGHVRLHVWGWNGSVRHVWQTGQPFQFLGRLQSMVGGGTPDASTLRWARNSIGKELRTGERPIIVILSDGDGEGPTRLSVEVAAARKSGIRVISVALSDDLHGQRESYGDGNFVRWPGSIGAVAAPLAAMVGRAIGA